MQESHKLLADRLLEEGDRVLEFFNSLTPEQWQINLYPEVSDWNFHNLLAHFVSAEIGRRELISDVCLGGSGASKNFNIDQYNQQGVEEFSGETHDTLLELFRRERANFVKLVLELTDADLEIHGNDPYLGDTTLAEMIKLTYRHLQIHLREVRRLI